MAAPGVMIPTRASLHLQTVPEPYVCNDCHNLSNTSCRQINHPTGPGTPFPTGTSADIPSSCVVCHMVAADGKAKSHLFRISAFDYTTFPTPAQLYNQNITAPNVAADGAFGNAMWNDVDFACGQCHIGGNGSVNPYGLTPAGAVGARTPMSKALWSPWRATCTREIRRRQHPRLRLAQGSSTRSQSVTLADATPGVTIYYNTDGTTPPNSTSSIYSGTPIPVSANTTIKAVAVGVGGWTSSLMGSGTYTIQTPAPTLSPTPGTFTTPQSVTLADATPGATILLHHERLDADHRINPVHGSDSAFGADNDPGHRGGRERYQCNHNRDVHVSTSLRRRSRRSRPIRVRTPGRNR